MLSSGMPKFRQNVAALIVNRKGEILVCERIKTKGAWQFPQGGVDKGETILEALLREVEEEVGLTEDDYKVVEYRDEYFYFYPAHIRAKKKWDGQEQTYFLCKLKKKAKEIDLGEKSAEFGAYCWVKPEDFEVEWLPSFKVEVYREVMRDFFDMEI